MSSYLPLQMSRSRISTDLLSGLSTQLPHTAKPTILPMRVANWTAPWAIVLRLRNPTIRFSTPSPSRYTHSCTETQVAIFLTIHLAQPLPTRPGLWRSTTPTRLSWFLSVDHTQSGTGLRTLLSRTQSQDYATAARLSWDSGQRGMW